MKILYLMELIGYLCTLSISLPVNALSLQQTPPPPWASILHEQSSVASEADEWGST